MDENKNQPNSFIQVIFSDVGSVLFSMTTDGVTSLQMLALAEYLHILGEAGLLQEQVNQKQKAQQNRIVIPGTELPNIVR
jgi:hypothetical protein